MLAGCAGTGKDLIFNTVVSAIFQKLPGDDPNLVISNSTATDVEIWIKFTG